MSCAICFERFKGSDNNLYSTSCGHIYHFVCMQQWKSRSTSCPQCRAYNPKTHKIYLELDDEPNTSLLEDQLRECRSRISQLQLELKSGKKFSTVENTKKCQVLEETLENTLEHNETIEKKLKEAEIKISYLQTQCNTNVTQISILNENLNKITAEKHNLELQYKQLQVENNRINKANDLPTNTHITQLITNMMLSSSLKLVGIQINPGTKLINYVLYLGHKMDIHQTRSDIIRTVLVNEEQTLFVQFRTECIQKAFFANAYKLSYYNETGRITISNDVPYDIFCNTLFDYALNLKMFNYRAVFRQNKKVMANKDDFPIRIYSKEHVEELVEQETWETDSEYCDSSDYY